MTIAVVLQAQAAFAALTITRTTWNVIGLDSNNVADGPNIFPVAAVVCNTGAAAATNLTTTFSWDSSNSLITLSGVAAVNRGTLPSGGCLQAYYWVAVTRTPAAYATVRRYHITVSADGGITASTPVRELFVERLISQNRNTSQTPSGPTTVVVGQTYTFNWTGGTATQGYEQIVNFMAFDAGIFRVLSVQSTYSAGASPVAAMYNDACSWNDDPASAGYRSCAGSGKAGGAVTMSVTVQVIGTGSTTLAGAIYDFSGSSFHYNADFGRNVLPVTAITGGADLSVTKTNDASLVTAGGATSYTVVVNNAGPSAADGAVVSDPAAAGLSKTSVSCTAAGGAVCPAPVTVSGLESGLVVPTLPSGGTLTFVVSALVTALNGSVANAAIVAAPAGLTDPNSANNSATDTDPVTSSSTHADLAVTKTNFMSTLSPGATTTYTVIVTNDGPGAAVGAALRDVAPDGLTIGAWTCSGAGGATCPAAGTGNIDIVVTLPAESSLTLQISATVRPDAGGSVTNTVTVNPPAGTTDPNPNNNTARDTDTIAAGSGQADLKVTKTNGVSALAPGSTTVYAVVVSNSGPNSVTSATVTDLSADDLTIVSWTCSGSGGGSCPASGVGNVGALVTLAAGASVTFQITATVSPQAHGSVTNTATVTLPAGVTDQDPSNNIAADTDAVVPAAGPAPVPPSPEPGVDSAPSLSLTKVASAGIVEIGEAIVYSIRIWNAAGSLPALAIHDQLPLGFSYIPGSAQLVVGATSIRLPDPAGAQTRRLVFTIREQPGASEGTITYRVRASAGAQQGNGTNCATAVTVDGASSNRMCVRVLVSSGVFTQQACVMGKIFVDTSGNGVQDAKEAGVPGVALYLEDGTSLRTDGGGAFSYCGISAGTHVLKVDPTTLPSGASLVPVSNRHGLDGGSAFLDVKFGEVHRTDFVLQAGGPALETAIDRRAAAARAGTLGQEALPLPDMVAAEALPQAIQSSDGAQPPMMAVGVVEGIVSLHSLRGRSPAARAGDVFDDELRRFSRTFDNGKGVAAARAAMFMQGTVRRDYRLSLSFDSERPDRGVLFRDIQPDAFYPIYGDASQKRFDAQSSRRFYARVERDRTYLLFGDFVTARETPARNLGTYSRTLTGAQHRFDKGRMTVNVFAARDTLRQVIDEVGGRGISGPYSVSQPNGVSGSEKVEIVTRDRNQPAIILRTQPQTRFLDYEFEPFTGRVLFRRPVPSLDEQLNPVSVRITYEVETGGRAHWIDGIDGALALSRHVALGGSWVQDKSPVAPYELASANGTVTLGKHTTLIAEVARSVATVNSNPFNQRFVPNLVDAAGEAEGNAARVELTLEARGVRARAYAGMSEPAFYNPAATLNGGRSEAGARASYQLQPGSLLLGELIRSSDRLTGGQRQGGSVGMEARFRRLRFEAGLRHVRESAEPAYGTSAGLIQPFGVTTLPGFGFAAIDGEIDPMTGLPVVRPGFSPGLSAGLLAPPAEPLEYTTVRGRLSTSIGSAGSAYVEGEQDVADSDKHMAAVGGEYRASDRARLYLRHELITSLDGIYELRSGLRTQRTVFGVASSYLSAGELFSEYRMDDAIAGREAQAAIGLRQAWTVADGVRLSTSMERLNPIRSAGQSGTAASLGAEFTGSPQVKGTTRVEWRREGATDSWLSTAGIARRLSSEWTMLAKNYYQRTQRPDGGSQVQDRVSAGAAYRDADRNRHNVLSRYEFKFERLPAGTVAGLVGDRRVHTISAHGDRRLSRPWILSAQYAGKWVQETLDQRRDRYAAHLISSRAGYDITRRLDIGGLASAMWSGSDERLRKALGVESGLLLMQNTWLSVGYNITGFSDRDFDDVLNVDSTTRGFFVRLRVKFDEGLLRMR